MDSRREREEGDVIGRDKQLEEIERLNRELEMRVQQRTAELRRSLKALELSETRLSLALDIETVGVIFFNWAGRITDCNEAFLRMSGLTRKDVETGALRWDGLTPCTLAQTAAMAEQEFPARTRIEPFEREYERKDGSRWWALVAARQHLTALSLELGHAMKEAGPNAALSDRLGKLAELARVMTGDARTLALELRPPELDDVGLAGAVETFLTQWTSRYGIPVDLELCNLEARVPPAEPATTIFRILQEAMTNIARHSSASEVSVIVERPDGHINLIVEDNGRGFNVDEVLRRASRDQRFGLAGMRERAELAGGELDVESAIGVGTTLFVKVPVQEAGTDAAAT